MESHERCMTAMVQGTHIYTLYPIHIYILYIYIRSQLPRETSLPNVLGDTFSYGLNVFMGLYILFMELGFHGMSFYSEMHSQRYTYHLFSAYTI